MLNSLRALFREAMPQEITSDEAPQAVLDRLRAAATNPGDSGLSGRVDASTFELVLASGPRSTRYPGSASGVVKATGVGSRIVYRVAVPPRIRVILQVWAVISVVIGVVCLLMATAALALGAIASVLFSLFVPAVLFIVWRHWSHLQRHSRELNERLRTTLAVDHSSSDRSEGLHNNKMQQTSQG